MSTGKSIARLAYPVVYPDVEIKQKRSGLLIALLLQSHDKGIEHNVEDEHEGY
jgi:hypothetical protein